MPEQSTRELVALAEAEASQGPPNDEERQPEPEEPKDPEGEEGTEGEGADDPEEPAGSDEPEDDEESDEAIRLDKDIREALEGIGKTDLIKRFGQQAKGLDKLRERLKDPIVQFAVTERETILTLAEYAERLNDPRRAEAALLEIAKDVEAKHGIKLAQRGAETAIDTSDWDEKGWASEGEYRLSLENAELKRQQQEILDRFAKQDESSRLSAERERFLDTALPRAQKILRTDFGFAATRKHAEAALETLPEIARKDLAKAIRMVSADEIIAKSKSSGKPHRPAPETGSVRQERKASGPPDPNDTKAYTRWLMKQQERGAA